MTTVSGRVEINGNQLLFIPERPLAKNQLVRVRVRQTQPTDTGQELYEELDFTFVTELDPFYNRVDNVRRVAGGFIDDVEDMDVAIVIHQSSKYADIIAARPYGSINDWFPGERQSQATNASFFHDFVLYDAAIKLLLGRTTQHMGERSEHIQIGPIATRESGSMAPEISIVLSRLEKMRAKAEKLLRLGPGTSSTVVADRIYSEYPYPHRNNWRRLI